MDEFSVNQRYALIVGDDGTPFAREVIGVAPWTQEMMVTAMALWVHAN